MQRFSLGFSNTNDENSFSSENLFSTVSYRYMIITRSKSRSHPIIAKLQQLSNKLRLLKFHNNLKYKIVVENRDDQLLECLLKLQCLRGSDNN